MPVRKTTEEESVNSYMLRLKHPLKEEIELVRRIIKSSDRRIKERIKWNAPSYYCTEDLLTFNPRNQKAVHLVFHHPAIMKIKSLLLVGEYNNRKMAYFKDMQEIKKNKPELQKIMRRLTESIEKLNSKSIKKQST